MKKNPTKKERKEIYSKAIDVVLGNMKEVNYLCNVIGKLLYGKHFDTMNSERSVNKETFPELLLFRDGERETDTAWLSLFHYWDLQYTVIGSNREGEILINEGKLTILLLCIEMCK